MLHYTETGTGPVLILLHGNGENSEYFKNQIPEFSKHFRVIAPDTRGHGKSLRGTAPFTLDQFAEDLLRFMDMLSIPRAHILGFSDGGNIALKFALKHPERVDKLILNGANLDPSGVKARFQAPITIGYGLTSIISKFDKNAQPKKELLGLMVKEPNIPIEKLARLHMPVLVIAGNRDLIKTEHTADIAAAIPNSTLCIIEGGHFIAANNSTEFNKKVLDFLRD